MQPVKDYLRQREIPFSEIDGDIFIRGRDGRAMYIRARGDGTYDWSVNDAGNDKNLLDYREPMSRSEVEVLDRVYGFWTKTKPGPLLIDTLGMVERATALGLSREQAEHAVMVARKGILAMHESGMDAKEIKVRFAEQLRNGDLPKAPPDGRVEE